MQKRGLSRYNFRAFYCFLMFAVIHTGAKQYLVREGDTLRIETVLTPVGKPHAFQKVLAYSSDDTTLEIGTPFLKKTVIGEILEHGKGDKILVYKMKAKKNYRRSYGHRQPYSAVRITKIGSV